MGIVRDVRFEFPRTVFFKFLSLILSQICLLGTSNMVDRNRSQGRLCRQRLLICKTLNQLMTEKTRHSGTCYDKLRPGWSQVSRPSEPERGQGGSQSAVSGFSLAGAGAGGSGRRWW